LNNELNEVFEFLPKNLVNIGSFHGEQIYSNDKIINISLDWMRRSKITSPIAEKIKEGISKGAILIGYANNNKLAFIFRRIGGAIKPKSTSILGKYSSQEQKLAILLDENVDMLGRAVREIPTTVTHELIHMASNYNTKLYLSTTLRPLLLPFYKRFFNKVASKTSNIPDNILSKAIIDLSMYSENLSSPPDMGYVFSIWANYFENIYPEEKSKNIFNNLSTIFLMIHGSNLNSTQKDVARTVFKKYCETYKDIGYSNVCSWTTPGQELVYTSEVIGVTNQWKLSSNVARLINSIRF